jgi:KipI family sensor histidine kinase inhibitor
MTTRVRHYGDRAWLAEIAPQHVRALSSYAAGLDTVARVVPAACTVLVRMDESATAATIDDVADALAKFDPTEAEATIDTGQGHEHLIDVTYDGEDLATVASSCAMSIEAVIAMHTTNEYRVAFCGFSPGFAYLTGLNPRLQLPRRESPRTLVPAGSVAIASEYTAVYPRTSPGGWLLIGRTEELMWDLGRERPSLLEPGDSVRFRAVQAS